MSGSFKIRNKIRTNKLDHNPLFIKILNWTGDKYTVEKILDQLYDSFPSDSDKSAVSSKKASLTEDYLNTLIGFQKKFRTYVDMSLRANNISDEFVLWLNNAFKYVGEKKETYLNDESRVLHIKDPDGRWLEGIFCYNFIMTVNYFGLEVIKRCPCSLFFSNKGKYARYCSESCKAVHGKQRARGRSN